MYMDTGTDAIDEGEPISQLLMLPPGLLASIVSVGERGDPVPVDDGCGSRTAFC